MTTVVTGTASWGPILVVRSMAIRSTTVHSFDHLAEDRVARSHDAEVEGVVRSQVDVELRRRRVGIVGPGESHRAPHVAQAVSRLVPHPAAEHGLLLEGSG